MPAPTSDEWRFTPAQRGRSATRLDIPSLVASRQKGLVTRVELLASGISPSAIDRMVAAGRLRVVFPGVYALGHLALRPEAFALAAVLACGPGSVLSHRSAAAAWNVRPAPASFHEVTIAGARGRGLRGIRTHRNRLPADEVTSADGLPVTTWARTVLDVAAVEDEQRIRRMLEASEHERLFDGRALAALLERHRGRRGAGRLRTVLDAFDGDGALTRLKLEARALDLVREARLPRPLVNAVHLGHEIDLLWLRERLAVELDSWTFHRARPAFERDRRRDVELQVAGFRTVRFTWPQVDREPDWVVARLRTLLSGG